MRMKGKMDKERQREAGGWTRNRVVVAHTLPSSSLSASFPPSSPPSLPSEPRSRSGSGSGAVACSAAAMVEQLSELRRTGNNTKQRGEYPQACARAAAVRCGRARPTRSQADLSPPTRIALAIARLGYSFFAKVSGQQRRLLLNSFQLITSDCPAV